MASLFTATHHSRQIHLTVIPEYRLSGRILILLKFGDLKNNS